MMPTINSFTVVALGNSLAVQWLRLQAFTAGNAGLIPHRATKISQSHKPHSVAKKIGKEPLPWKVPWETGLISHTYI